MENLLNSLIVINSGKERASYSVGFTGHIDSDGQQISITKRTIEVLHRIVELGASFNDLSKVAKVLDDRISGFPGGKQILKRIKESGVTTTDFIVHSSKMLDAVSKESNCKERAKRGHGHAEKSSKYLNSIVAKLVCKLAPASKTGGVTEEMLEGGYENAMNALEQINKAEVIAMAKTIADKTGLDFNGYIKLRSKSSEEETE